MKPRPFIGEVSNPLFFFFFFPFLFATNRHVSLFGVELLEMDCYKRLKPAEVWAVRLVLFCHCDWLPLRTE